MIVALLAFLTVALFTGAAVYVSIVEHPARLALDDRAAITQWAPSYARGSVMQGGLAMVASVLGLIAWWQSSDLTWLVGAVAIAAPWPYTVFVIMPVNRRLKAMAASGAGDIRGDLRRWGNHHLVRVSLGVIATVAYLVALTDS